MFVRRESFRQFVSRYRFLSVIIAANLLVFLYTAFTIGADNTIGLVELGGLVPQQYAPGEYWRYLTYAFIHNGFMHLLMNMFFLIVIGPPLEVMLGRLRMALLFVCSVGGSALLVMTLGSQYGIGASGFAYGLLGLYIYIIVRHRHVLDRNSRNIVLIWMAVGWLSTLFLPGISFYGHLGGFLGGFVFGFAGIGGSGALRRWS